MTGCKSGPKGGPIKPPAVEAEVGHFVGSSLSGPQATVPADLGAAGVWRVTGRLVAVTNLPDADFTRIGPKARLVVAYRGPAPVAASTRLTSGVSIFVPKHDPGDDQPIDARLGDPKTREEQGTFVGGVALGTTASFSVGLKQIPEPTREQLPLRTRVAVQISRTTGNTDYLLTIVGDDLVAEAAPADANKDAEKRPPPTTLNRELAVISRTLAQGHDRFVLAVPFTFTDSNARGLVYEISIDADPQGDDRAAALAALQAGAKTAAESAGRTSTTRPDGTSQQVLIQTAIKALANGSQSPRGTLNYIAAQSGASLSGELALVADEEMLKLLTQQVLKTLNDGQTREPAQTALLMERASADVLGAIRNSGSNSLSGAVLGTLDSYAGEVGHQVDSLLAVIKQASSMPGLSNRLIKENFIYLEDTSPPARVRAFDWLRGKGIDLTGYEPLAKGSDRRAALDKIRATATGTAQP